MRRGVTRIEGASSHATTPTTSQHWSRFLPTDDPHARLRLAFYLGGLACFGAERFVEFYHLNGGSAPAALILHFLLPLGGVGALFVACRSTLPHLVRGLLPFGRPLLLLGLLVTLLLAARGIRQIERIPSGLAQPQHYLLDSVAMTACGVDLLAQGRNPYTDFYLVECLPHYGLDGGAATPLQAGAFALKRRVTDQDSLRVFAQAVRRHVQAPAEFESHFSYPAGAFLIPLPFMRLVRHDVSLFYLVCILLAYLLLAWIAPRRVRPWVLFFAVANLSVWAFVTGTADDSLEVLFVLAGWVTWRRSWLSAVLMGLAIATRQNAWFFLPFYTILVGRSYGWRVLAQRLAGVMVVFGIVNGWFIVHAPSSWLAGILAPARDPMYPEDGLAGLAQQGLLPLWPRATYTMLELGVLLGGALYYARICRRDPGAGVALAFLPLLVAWRSPYAYVLPLTILGLWPLLADLRTRLRPAAPP